MSGHSVTRVQTGLPDGFALERGPAPEYRWIALRTAPTEYCLRDPDQPGQYLSFATIEEGQAWFATQFGIPEAGKSREARATG